MLCLLDFDFCHVVLAIPRVVHLKGWIASTVDPLLEELGQAATCDVLECPLQVGCDHLSLSVARDVGMDRAFEGCFAELMAQHMEYPGTFFVKMSVEQRKAIVMVDIVDDGTAVMSIFTQIILLEAEHRLLEIVCTQIVFSPELLKVCSKAFVQPTIRPVTAGQQVTKPLMSQFVR